MRDFALIIALALALPVYAGIVQSDAGPIEGKLTIADGKIVVQPSQGPAASVPLDKVVAVSFDAPAALPTTRRTGWQTRDIGDVNHPGTLSIKNDRFTLTDRSRGMRTRKKGFDSLFFVCQEIRGDHCTLTARLMAIDGQKSARAGLMIRPSTREDAPYAMVLRGENDENSGMTTMVRRATAGADHEIVAKMQHRVAGAVYLRLLREGYAITMLESLDQKNWKPIATAEIPMNEDVLVGLFSTASTSSGGRETTAVFTAVELVADEKASAQRSAAGVLLKSGSALAGSIESADATSLNLQIASGQRTIPLSQVAQCRFIPLLATHEQKLRSAGTGVLLINGDFLDGEFKAIESNQVKMVSVLFGAKSIDLRQQAAALNLRQPEPSPAQYEVILHDRSMIRAQGLKLAAGQVIIQESILGEMKLSSDRIREIRRAK